MPNKILLYGPAASGKTTKCLEIYCNELKPGLAGKSLFIVPAARISRRIKQAAAIEWGAGAVVWPGIMTFRELTEILLRGQEIREISDTGRRFLVAEVIAELSEEGKIEYFSEVREFTGFVVAVENLISELKEGEYLPEDLQRAVKQRNNPKDKCVLEIFRRYQEKLEERQLFDTAGKQFIAVQALKAAGSTVPMLASPELVVADGFHSFTPVELHMLEILSDRAKESYVTLPYDEKVEVFEPVKKTFDRLVEKGFVPRKQATGKVKPVEVEVLEAPDVWREALEVAREVKTVIVEKRYGPSDICIVFRSAEEDAERMREALRMCGVPCAIGPSSKVAATPIISRLVSSVCELMHSTGQEKTVAAFLKMFLAGTSEVKAREDLYGDKRTWLIQRNLRALDAFENALRQIWLSAAHTGIAGKKMRPHAFLELFELAIGAARFSEEPHAGDRVLVTGAHEARELRFKVVFLCGLSFGVFPRHYTEEPIYGDQERREINSAGSITLAERSLMSMEEEFLFYMAASRASEKLYLSYSQTDRAGRQILRSYMIDEYLKKLEGDGCRIHAPRHFRASEVVPEPQRISSVQDFLQNLAVSNSAFSADQPRGKSDAWTDLFLETLSFMNHGLEIIRERRSAAGRGAFDGRLRSPLVLQDIGLRFGKDRVFPVTVIEGYVKCPFKFYCEQVLGLTPPVKALEAMEPKVMGSICHRVLYRVFCLLKKKEGDGGLNASDAGYAASKLEDMITEETRARSEKGERTGEFPDIEVMRLKKWLETFIRWNLEKDKGNRPLYLEVAFGNSRAGGKPEGTVPQLELREDVKLSGRIDRIDSGPEGGLIVIDYKISTISSAPQMRQCKDIQLSLYARAAGTALEKLGHKVTGIAKAKYYSVRGCGQSVLDFKKDEDREAVESACLAACKAVDGIREGAFTLPPEEGSDSCRWCDFPSICRREP